MPEAPQIRLIVKDLQPFVGKKVIKATTQEKDFDPKWKTNSKWKWLIP